MHEVMMDDFVMLQADWPAYKARQLIEGLSPSHVIVHRTEPEEEYNYLYTKEEALHSLKGVTGETSIQVAFELHEYQAAKTLDAYVNAEETPDRSVVVEEGRIVGFYDASVIPRGTRRVFRGPDRTDIEPVARSLVADFPEQVLFEETVSLLVSLTTESRLGAALPVALPIGSKVDVVVQPKHGFVLEGRGEGSIFITDEEELLPLQFKLKAIEVGPGKLIILAFYKGDPLGKVTLVPVVVPATQMIDGRRSSREQPLTPLSIHQPDLSLLILEHEIDGQPAFTMRLTATDPGLGLYLKEFGPVQMRMNPLEYFKDFFKDIENLQLGTPQELVKAEQRLAAKGALLFETLIPKDMQVLLWSLRNRIGTVQIVSEEPWIPWELCKLQGKDGERVVEGPFFCESFAITRWMPGIGRKPSLRLRKVALVVPRDSGLPYATSERDFVLSLANGGRQVDRIPANYLDVRTALAAGVYDSWHFTGHGGFRAPDPNRSAIFLENEDELTPEDLSGVVKNLGLAKPIVFLNACQIGRGGMSLTDIGGWAAQFLRADVAAFIGSHWSVYDQAANDFAKAFYNRLLSGMTIGKAIKEARAEIRPLGDPTWLAYTVFADPLARIKN